MRNWYTVGDEFNYSDLTKQRTDQLSQTTFGLN